MERRRRGRDDHARLEGSDFLFVSYGKSGRTWVRVEMSRYYQVTRGLRDGMVLGYDNFHRIDPTIPTIFFTHDNYVRAYLGHPDTRQDYYDHPTVLLVRNPQDVAVSQFFQWKFRMRAYKKALNGYPPHGADISLYDFVMHSHQGLPRIVDFLNGWARELDRFQRLLVVRYEDMRANPEAELTRLMAFLGEEVAEAAIRNAVEFASVDNMRRMESGNTLWRAGSRVRARDPGNPDSYKVRKAKVGGYRDYFDDDQIAAIDAMVNEQLAPVFGYTAAETGTPAVVAEARSAP